MRTTGADPGQPLEDAEDELEQPDLGEAFVRARRQPRRIRLDRVARPVGSAADLGHEAGRARRGSDRAGPAARPGRRRGTSVAERLDERPVRQAAGPERKAAPVRTRPPDRRR